MTYVLDIHSAATLDAGWATSPERVATPARAASLQIAGPAADAAPGFDPAKDAEALHDGLHSGFLNLGTIEVLGVTFGVDVPQVLQTLQGKTPGQISTIAAEYQTRYSRDLEADLRHGLSGRDLQRVEYMLAGDQAALAAMGLHDALHAGFRPDVAAVKQLLQGRSEEQLAEIERKYEALHGSALLVDLEGRLELLDVMDVKKIIHGAPYELNLALQNPTGADMDTIVRVLSNRSTSELEKIVGDFQKAHGYDLATAMQRKLWPEDLKVCQALMKGGEPAAAAAGAYALHSALRPLLGPDSPAIFAALQGKSPAQAAQVANAYEAIYGQALPGALESRLRPQDLAVARFLLQGDGVAATGQLLRNALGAAWGPDLQALIAQLEGHSREELAQVEAWFQGTDERQRPLRAVIQEKLSGTDRDLVLALLDADPLRADAARLRAEVLRTGTTQIDRLEALRGRTREEIEAVLAVYSDVYIRAADGAGSPSP